MNEFEILRSVAQRDLRDAQLLFKKKRYPNAIFLLEQADEKAGKAVLLHMGLALSSNEIGRVIQFLRSHPAHYTNPLIQLMTSLQNVSKATEWQTIKNLYGHDWLRSFLKILSKIVEPVDAIGSKARLFESLESGFDSSNPAVKGIIWEEGNWKERVAKLQETFKDRSNYLNPTVKDLEGEISECIMVFNTLKPSGIDTEQLKKQFGEIIGSDFSEAHPLSESSISDIFADPLKLFVLGALGLYLCPHYSLTRYPDEDVDFEYDSDFALVRKNKDIISLIEQCI